MNKLAIFGAGGFGRETVVLESTSMPSSRRGICTGFFDHGIAKGQDVSGLKVLGGIEEVNALKEPVSLIIAAADPNPEATGCFHSHNKQVSFPVIAHPGALLGSETNYFGEGSIITAGCIIDQLDIVTGEFAIVNLSCTIGHDVKIGKSLFSLNAGMQRIGKC